MTASASSSLSTQASTVLDQRQQQQQHQKDGDQERRQQQQQNLYPPNLSLWKKMMLAAALFGTEATTAFEQVYTYLSLQYLGVPVSLMSLNGVVAGPTAIVLIPALGLLVDKGSNPKKRKMLALLFGLCLILTGFFLVISACSLKIASMTSLTNIHDEHPGSHNSTDLVPSPHTSQFPQGLPENKMPIPVDNEPSQNVSEILTSEDKFSRKPFQMFSSAIPAVNDTFSNKLSQFEINGTPEAEDVLAVDYSLSPSMTVAGVLGLLGYILMDVGFDIGNPFVRAFVLDHTSPAQHTNLLVTATLMASSAGTLMSMLGVFDLPSALGEMFHVDGTAATFIFLLVILIFVVNFCFACSFLTGSRIKKQMEKEKNYEIKTHRTVMSSSQQRFLHRSEQDCSHGRGFLKSSLKSENLGHSYNDKTSLLSYTDTTNQTAYLSFSLSVSSAIPVDSDVTTVLSRNLESEKSSLDASTKSGTRDLDKSELSDTSKLPAICEGPAQSLFYDIDKKDKAIVPHQINGVSVSNTTAPLGDSHKKKHDSSNKKTLRKRIASLNKQLFLMIFASCFSMSAMISFIMYIPNTLTIGVFHGDPLALPGTPENENYQQGLRGAALGSLIFYVFYFITSTFNVKIYEVIGERGHFMVTNAALAIATGAFVITQRVEAYYVAMATFGPFRTCIYTTTFVLANKYTEFRDHQNSDENATTTKAGRAMSIIGVVLPCNYIIVSSVMAPLIDLTGSVWLPLIWCAIANVLAMVIFTSLFFVSPD